CAPVFGPPSAPREAAHQRLLLPWVTPACSRSWRPTKHRQDLRVCVRLAADGHRAGAAPRRRLRRPPEEARAAGGGGRRAPPAPGALRGGVLPRAAHRAPRHVGRRSQNMSTAPW
ncbi:unnamed protein product, partial [Prorocentrum cordatum]